MLKQKPSGLQRILSKKDWHLERQSDAFGDWSTRLVGEAKLEVDLSQNRWSKGVSSNRMG